MFGEKEKCYTMSTSHLISEYFYSYSVSSA